MSFYKAVKCKKEYLNKTVGSATDNFYIYLSSLGAFLFFFKIILMTLENDVLEKRLIRVEPLFLTKEN